MGFEFCLGNCGGPNGWEVAGTVATIGATAAALLIPFLMEWRQRRDRERASKDDRQFNAREILWAADEALSVYEIAYTEMKQMPVGDRTLRLRDMGQRGHRATQVLNVLLKRPNLTDGMIKCGVDAAALGQEVEAAMGQRIALDFLLPMAIRAKRVAAQIDRLAQTYGPPERRKAAPRI